MAIAAQSGKDEFANVLSEGMPAPEVNHEATSILGVVREALLRMPDRQTLLQAYIPVTAYVPLFCLMAEDAGPSRAGCAIDVAPLAAGSVTYAVNYVRITWVPPA